MRPILTLAASAALIILADPALAQDRYSAGAPQPPAPGAARAAGLRFLTWPGKVVAETPPAQAPRRPVAAIAPAPQPPRTPALPTSIYAPAAPATPAVKALAMAAPPTGSGSASPRFYSLHRAYGETPDPVALGPQFFVDGSPDLAQPPPPIPRPQTTATGQVVRALPTDPDASGAPAS